MSNIDGMVTEQRNERTNDIDTLTTEAMLRVINDEDKGVPYAVEETIPAIAAAADIVTAQLRQGGTLYYVGAGTSGRLGVLDASECPPTYRSDPEQVQGIIAGGKEALVRSIEGAEDYEEDGAEVMRSRGVTVNDVVCGIATSGKTPYVIGALKYAKSKGIPTVALVCNPIERLDMDADVIINPIVGPEVITGSTRMKAGTATKLILNMITTATMIKLGKVYGNLMVDLTAVNKKLVDRAERIVMEVTGVSREEARTALKPAQYKVKHAILMSMGGVSFERAEHLLVKHQGMLRGALEEVQSS